MDAKSIHKLNSNYKCQPLVYKIQLSLICSKNGGPTQLHNWLKKKKKPQLHIQSNKIDLIFKIYWTKWAVPIIFIGSEMGPNVRCVPCLCLSCYTSSSTLSKRKNSWWAGVQIFREDTYSTQPLGQDHITLGARIVVLHMEYLGQVFQNSKRNCTCPIRSCHLSGVKWKIRQWRDFSIAPWL